MVFVYRTILSSYLKLSNMHGSSLICVITLQPICVVMDRYPVSCAQGIWSSEHFIGTLLIGKHSLRCLVCETDRLNCRKKQSGINKERSVNKL